MHQAIAFLLIISLAFDHDVRALECRHPDGSRVDVTLLRQVKWLQAEGVAVGRTIDLKLPEMGVDGPARVLVIEPCPEIQKGANK